MATSGTYAFNPSLDQLTIEAFSRIQIRPTSLTRQHMVDAVTSANLVLVDFSVMDGPNLWEIVLNSFPLVQGQATYSVPMNVVAILDYYIRINPTAATPIDLIIYPISRTEYASQPNKTAQARPTTVWWDRTINSSLTFWQTPDAGPYEMFYYAMTQPQDAVMTGGTGVDLPYRFLDAFCAGLAWRLARKYPPDGAAPSEQAAFIASLKQEYDEAWGKASGQDTENVPLAIMPGLTSYFRY